MNDRRNNVLPLDVCDGGPVEFDDGEQRQDDVDSSGNELCHGGRIDIPPVQKNRGDLGHERDDTDSKHEHEDDRQ